MADSEQTATDGRLVVDPQTKREIDLMAADRGVSIKSLVGEMWQEFKRIEVDAGRWPPTVARTGRQKR